MTRPLRAVIDHHALVHNLRRVREAAPGSPIMAVVKANAYGHGAPEVARTLAAAGADGFAVISLERARALRAAGIDRPITLLQGPFSADELPEISALGLSIVVHEAWQLQALEQSQLAAPVPLWLKVDTGMHRLGFNPGEVAVALERLRRSPSVQGVVGLFSHLAQADEPGSAATRAQIKLFRELVATHAGPGGIQVTSLANSAAVLGWPDSHPGWVRPGIMLYGSSPFSSSHSDGASGLAQGLRPVMQLHSALIAVRRLQAGDRVGYGGDWTCPQPMPVGLVAGGYGDGYPRHARSGTPVRVNGRRVPLIGRVSMDSVCVDLRACPEAAVGDAVVLWGDDPHIDEIAAAAGTIAYQLMTSVSARVPFEQRMVDAVPDAGIA